MNKVSKKSVKPYLNDKYVKKWLTGLSQRTKENYTANFASWLAFIKMTPTEQIDKRLKDTSSTNMMERAFFEDKFVQYREHLEQRGNLKAAAIKSMLIPVASFFSRNNLPLKLKRGDWESNQVQEVKTARSKLTKEDIKSMYSHGNTRDRALLLVLAQSGFSEVDVSNFNLKGKDLKGLMEQPETEHFFIEKNREKTHETQATCFSYEALHDIKAMLQERIELSKDMRNRTDLTAKQKAAIDKVDPTTGGYLFISTTKNLGDQLDTRGIADAMKALAVKAFGRDSEKAKEFKAKMLRSFYNSALLRANIQPQELKDLMMGHQRRGARKKYSYDEVTIKEAYQRAFEHLSINGLQTRTDIAKLKEDMIKQKADFYDQLNAQKADFELRFQKMTAFMHKNYDPIVRTFDKLSDLPEGKVALEKLWELEEQKERQESMEAEQEYKTQLEEKLEKGKPSPKKQAEK